MKLIPFVGSSGSGKTTLLEKIIPELKKRGYLLGVIKHDTHQFEIDHEGKDSYRLKKAGAHSVCISSSEKLGLVKNVDEDLSPDYIANDLFSNLDLVLTEGYKDFPVPKIEIFRSEVGISYARGSDLKACPDCGSSVEEGVSFCRTCGAYPI